MTKLKVEFLNKVYHKLAPIIKSNKLVLIRSPTGTGKTRFITRFCGSLDNERVLFISVNKTNCYQLDAGIIKANEDLKKESVEKGYKFKKLKIKSYIPTTRHPDEYMDANTYLLDYTDNFYENLETFKNVIINCSSLHRLLDKDNNLVSSFDYIVIDEVSSLFASILSPPDNVNFDRNILAIIALVKLFKSNSSIIGLDGYIPKDLQNIMQKLISKRSFYIRNYYKKTKRVKIHFHSSSGIESIKRPKFKVFEDIKNKLVNQDQILISGTTKKTINRIFKYSRSLCETTKDKLKIACVTSDVNLETNISTFLNNKRKKIILLYTPKITTAVDLKHFHGIETYHLMNSKKISSVVNYQMINRARGAKHVNVIVLPSLRKPNTKVFSLESLFEYFDLKTSSKTILGLLKASYASKDNLVIPDWDEREYSKSKMLRKSKLRLFVVSYVSYMCKTLKLETEFKEYLNNKSILSFDELSEVILIAKYYLTQSNKDDKASVYSNFIKLLKQDGYSIKIETENKLASKSNIELDLNIPLSIKTTTRTIPVIKLAQYTLYKYPDINFNKDINKVKLYNIFFKNKILKNFLKRAWGKIEVTDKVKINRIYKVMELLNNDLFKGSVDKPTPSQLKFLKA